LPQETQNGIERCSEDIKALARRFQSLRWQIAELGSCIALRERRQSSNLHSTDRQNHLKDELSDQMSSIAFAIILAPAPSMAALRAKALVVREYVDEGSDDIMSSAARSLAESILQLVG
jgi:hypothetical protein